jgi:hypothetical protein
MSGGDLAVLAFVVCILMGVLVGLSFLGGLRARHDALVEELEAMQAVDRLLDASERAQAQMRQVAIEDDAWGLDLW